MPITEEIETTPSYHRFTIGRTDRESADPRALRHMLFHIFLIRGIESRLLELKDRGMIHGPVHSSIGQEGTAVGAMQALERTDLITSTHRGHHHFLAKALNAYAGGDYDPLETIPETVEVVVRRTMAEIMGMEEGYCRGRGGSMHLGDRFSGCIGTNAIVAGGVPCAAGAAWAAKMEGSGGISVAFLGDGALGQGSVYETLNMAALWRVPVVFFIENNLYAVATHVRRSFPIEHLAQRGLGFDIPALVVDGMDPLAVFLAMNHARRIIAERGGPVIIEAENYRYKHQAQSLPGSAYGYRSVEEEEEWALRDPVAVFPRILLETGALTPAGSEEISRRSAEITSRAAADLERSAAGPRPVPSAPVLLSGVRGTGTEFDGIQFSEREDFPVRRSRKFIDVIPEVIRRRMDEDREIILIGEGVGEMKGGVFSATKGIYRVYPDRVVNTPISEAGFSGMALGLAIGGKKPVVEIMYPDFTLAAADQIFNQIAKLRYMYGNQYDLPIVFRTKVGIGTGYGAQHSMEPAPLYAMFPGWRIVAPSDPFDYIGLFNSAVRSLDPVLVIEHAFLYEEEGEVPEDRDYHLPLGKGRTVREGSDVTLLAYSYMTRKALSAAELLEDRGISAEVIDLRSVDYPSIDYELIGGSLAKTGRVVICEEGPLTAGIGGQLCYEIQARFFDSLDHEVTRVCALPVPVPVSVTQETEVIPGTGEIVAAVESAV